MEFYEEESVAKAIALTGQKLLDIPVIAKHTESEKNRLALQAASQAAYVEQPNNGYHETECEAPFIDHVRLPFVFYFILTVKMPQLLLLLSLSQPIYPSIVSTLVR